MDGFKDGDGETSGMSLKEDSRLRETLARAAGRAGQGLRSALLDASEAAAPPRRHPGEHRHRVHNMEINRVFLCSGVDSPGLPGVTTVLSEPLATETNVIVVIRCPKGPRVEDSSA